MNSLFIYNPAAGQINIEKEISRCLDQLTERGWTVDLIVTDRPRHATELAREAADDGRDMVVAVGGDGTISEVANGIVGTNTMMGVIPAGTTNVWALQMNIPSLPPWHPRKVVDRMLADLEEIGWHRPAGIPSWLADAFQVLLNSEVRAVDVGLVGGRYFLMWCGVGFDARVAESVVPEDKRRHGVWAYLTSGVSVAIYYTGARMRLALREGAIEEEVLMVVAANARLYGGVFQMAPSAYMDDGLLDVCVFRGEGIGDIVRLLTALLAGRHRDDADVDYMQVDYLSVASVPSQPVHADSEVCAATPVDISVLPRGLRVLVPANGANDLFCHPRLGMLRDFE